MRLAAAGALFPVSQRGRKDLPARDVDRQRVHGHVGVQRQVERGSGRFVQDGRHDLGAGRVDQRLQLAPAALHAQRVDLLQQRGSGDARRHCRRQIDLLFGAGADDGVGDCVDAGGRHRGGGKFARVDHLLQDRGLGRCDVGCAGHHRATLDRAGAVLDDFVERSVAGHQVVVGQEGIGDRARVVCGEGGCPGSPCGQGILDAGRAPHLVVVCVAVEAAVGVQLELSVAADQKTAGVRVRQRARSLGGAHRAGGVALDAGQIDARGRHVEGGAQPGQIRLRLVQAVGGELIDRHAEHIVHRHGRGALGAAVVGQPEVVVVEHIGADAARIGVVVETGGLFGDHARDPVALGHIAGRKPGCGEGVVAAQIAAEVVGLCVGAGVVCRGVGDKAQDQVLPVHALCHRPDAGVGQHLAGGKRQPLVVDIPPGGVAVGGGLQGAVVAVVGGEGEACRRAVADIELQVHRVDIVIFCSSQIGTLEIFFPGAGFGVAVAAHKPAVELVPHTGAFGGGGGSQIPGCAVDADFPGTAVVRRGAWLGGRRFLLGRGHLGQGKSQQCAAEQGKQGALQAGTGLSKHTFSS